MKIGWLTNIVKTFLIGAALFLMTIGPLPSENIGIGQPSQSIQQSSEPQSQPVDSGRGHGASLNWSGYLVTDGIYTGVSGTWTIPNVNNTNNFGVDATWVGIGGVTGHDLIQAGTQTAVDTSGRVSYEAFYEMLPDYSRPLNIDVNGGDSVTVTLNQEKTGEWLITLRNNTTGQSTQVRQNYDSSLSSAEWIEEAPSGQRRILPLDDFGTIQFTNAWTEKDGQIVNLSQVNAQPVVMANFSGQILASVSSLGSDGESFSVQRTDVQPEVFIPELGRAFSFD